jgi:hypothetical protein
MLRHLCFLAACVLSSPAHANDTAIGDDNGTITFKHQPAISMDSEALLISEELVTVDYLFTNTSSADVTTPIAFPMPPVYFGSSDHTEIENFKVWVDGKLVATERKWVIQWGDEDVSEKVRLLGWSVDDIFALLQNEKIPKGKKRLPKEWFDRDRPLLDISKYYIWQQKFPAGKSLSIRHSYSPSVTTGVPQDASTLFDIYGRDTCPDKSLIAGIEKRNGEGGWEYNHLSYILTTANNWQGAIKDFKLTIRKRKPSDVFTLCFDGHFKKTDSLTFEYRQADFRPKQDLKILFFRRFEMQ